MTHEEIEELLGAYALDAVSPAEREEIENHLAECPRCQQEVAAHLQVAGVLGSLGGTAPVGLWDKIAGALAIEPSEPGEPGETPPAIAPVIGLEAGRGRRDAGRRQSEGSRRRASVIAVASVAAALLVVVGVLASTIVGLDNRVSNLETAMVKGGVASQVRIAEDQAGSCTVALAATSGPWSAKLVLDQGQAFLVPSKLPSIASSETFQAWAVVKGKYVSLGVLGSRPGDVQLVLQHGMSEVAVNEEPQGGTPQPTNPVLLAAAV